MRKLALGILAAAGVALAVPASAQGIWVGAGPVGVGVGVGPGWGYHDGYYGPGYRSYAYDNDGYYVNRRHCRVITERFNGQIRKIRRCW
jgi:hypothetical protein